MKIFIIDDDKFLLDMYSIKCREAGAEINTATSAEEALAQIDNGYRADAYLIDILMPKMDGFQLIEKLKEKQINKDAALIILSNLGQQADVEKGLSYGVDGYIIKASATPSEVANQTLEIIKHKKGKTKTQ